MAVCWYLRHPLSATSVMELPAEQGIDVSNRTVQCWVQAFGPQLAAEARKHRRPLGRHLYTDEMFFSVVRISGTSTGSWTSTGRSWTCCRGSIATPHPLRR